jgi:hypothetical protein
MRGRLGTSAVTLWGVGLNIALQKGWLDWCPNRVVVSMLVVPLAIWGYIGLTHDRVKNYLRRTNRMVAITTSVFVGAIVGALSGGIIYALVARTSRSPSIDQLQDAPARRATLSKVRDLVFADKENRNPNVSSQSERW